jgi:hypothetical protein
MGQGICRIGGFIYVTGGLSALTEIDRGQKQPTPIGSCEKYNIETNTWTNIAHLVQGAWRASSSLVAVDGGKWLY